MLPSSLAVALSLLWEQEAMSPAPTRVAVAVCPEPGAAASAAATQATSTAKAIEASSETGFFIPIHPSLSGRRKSVPPPPVT